MRQLDDTVFLRHRLTAPGVWVHNFSVLKAEADRIADLLRSIDQDFYVGGRFENVQRTRSLDVLDIVFAHADVAGVIRDCLGLDPDRLDKSVQRLLYVFLIGQWGLLRPTDDYGNLTTESAPHLDLQVQLDFVPAEIEALRNSGDYETAKEEFTCLLMHVGFLDSDTGEPRPDTRTLMPEGKILGHLGHVGVVALEA